MLGPAVMMESPAAGPRERALEDGIQTLGDAELLAVVLGTGLAGRPVSLVAAGLLQHAGGLEKLGRLAPPALADHPGVGLAKALRIAASLELGRRAAKRAPRDDVLLSSSAAVAARMTPEIGSLLHEEMWVVCLDGRNRLRAVRKVAQGGLHSCAVMPRDVLRVALLEAASAMVLVHNHPSDDPLPSSEDLTLTDRLAEAADLVGVPLVDHVIIAPSGRYSSLLDLGMMGRTT